MARIAYVVTTHNPTSNRGVVYVNYTNGQQRKYKMTTVPKTAWTFCVTARNCDNEVDVDGTIMNTYYN